MKILIDTNIVLDVMLKREPFYRASAEILGLAKIEVNCRAGYGSFEIE